MLSTDGSPSGHNNIGYPGDHSALMLYNKDGIKVRKSESKDIAYLAQHMRKCDVDEVWAAAHKTPEEALREGMDHSIYCRTCENGNPILMFGIVPHSICGHSASVWMLSTDDIEKIKIKFLRHNKEYLDEMLCYYSRLENFVHSKNTKSVQWLKCLGATIEEARPYGVDQELYHHFYFERKS